MHKKQEDRRRKELEERQARDQLAKEREEKLKQLYESQRRRVEANLRLKQKQREAYSKALATSSVHIHLHAGSTTSSVSLSCYGIIIQMYVLCYVLNIVHVLALTSF